MDSFAFPNRTSRGRNIFVGGHVQIPGSNHKRLVIDPPSILPCVYGSISISTNSAPIRSLDASGLLPAICPLAQSQLLWNLISCSFPAQHPAINCTPHLLPLNPLLKPKGLSLPTRGWHCVDTSTVAIQHQHDQSFRNGTPGVDALSPGCIICETQPSATLHRRIIQIGTLHTGQLHTLQYCQGGKGPLAMPYLRLAS